MGPNRSANLSPDQRLLSCRLQIDSAGRDGNNRVVTQLSWGESNDGRQSP